MRALLTSVSILVLLPSWSPTYGGDPDTAPRRQATVTDVDGNEYRTVAIGARVWMAESLRVTRTPDGEQITSYFFADDSVRHADDGRLYTWDVAMNGATNEGAQGICPAGWHLPTDGEWMELFESLGSTTADGKQLHVGGSMGFNATLSGGADFRGTYLYYGELAMFWSSTVVNEERAYHHHVAQDGDRGRFAAMKGARISVRCIRDPA